MQFFRISMLGLIGLCSAQAQATSGHQFDYYGLHIQQNSYQHLLSSPQINADAFGPVTKNENSSGTGVRGFIGHHFNRFFAVEAGVASYGKADFSVARQVAAGDGALSDETVLQGDFETIAGDLRLVGTYSLSDSFYLKANLGALFWNNKLTTAAGSNAAVETNKLSDNGISAIAGFGVGYGINHQVAMTLDFEQTKVAGIKTQNLGASLVVKF